jgi:glucose-6-phosphate isomerase
MIELTQTKPWQALKSHHEQLKKQHLRQIFEENPDRFQDFSYGLNTILFDFSKHAITHETRDLLVNLAEARDVQARIAGLFTGEHCNQSEDKPALHVALRDLSTPPASSMKAEVLQDLERMWQLVTAVREGAWRGYTGEIITDVVHLGVGGSLLGPLMVTHALEGDASPLRMHFVSSLDGEQMTERLAKIKPAQTLFIIVSKTFTTEDTLSNAGILKTWFEAQGVTQERWTQHVFGVSCHTDAMTAFGIPRNNQFEMWDAVGGRYSVWSTVGLTVALAIGVENFKAFLDGAYQTDLHVQNEPLRSNIPVLMALLTVWYRDFYDYGSHVILPYDAHLAHFPAYLQQLEMESCGKQVTQDNHVATYKTGPVVWGDVGSNAEHSFFQLLHQGSDIIPADFITPVQSMHQTNKSQDLVLAHVLAQTQALMLGDEAYPSQRDDSVDVAHYFPGNRPSTTLMFPKLAPEVLGSLVACYEHKVFVQSVIWDINPFDQWGVELGKRLSKQLLSRIRGEEKALQVTDSSTQGLLDFIRNC